MDNLNYIDDYFKSSPTEQESLQFDQRIADDISFAEEVAFYVSANASIKQQLHKEKKERFREIYQQQKVVPITKQPVKHIWRYFAAASVIGFAVLLLWLTLGGKTSPQQLADQYIQQNLKTLGVTMGSQDSIQTALDLYNAGKLSESLKIFENMVKKDTTNDAIKKYTGIVSLSLKNYDKALYYFTWLENQTELYSNPGKFYHALTLLKRNNTGDIDKAKVLLKEVVENELEGQADAANWLKKM